MRLEGLAVVVDAAVVSRVEVLSASQMEVLVAAVQPMASEGGG